MADWGCRCCRLGLPSLILVKIHCFMLSNQQIKLFKSYQQKKFRHQDGVFVAETPKVAEVLMRSGLRILTVAALESWWERPANEDLLRRWERRHGSRVERLVVTPKELERISGLVQPQEVWMLLERPEAALSGLAATAVDALCRGCCLLLDGLQDPGNVGTVLRLADWFGMDAVLCTADCADVFQPKCVQASMGSVGVVPVWYAEREEWSELIRAKSGEVAGDGEKTCLGASDGRGRDGLQVFGTFMQGDNIYRQTLPQSSAWYIVGNEGKGISPCLEAAVGQRLSIPAFPRSGFLRGTGSGQEGGTWGKESALGGLDMASPGAESLNAAMATAILCSEIRRQMVR